MPSPVAHALAGVAAGWLIGPAPQGASRAHVVGRAAAFVAAALAPDLDLLAGGHSGPAHGLGAAVLVGALVWALVWMVRAAGSARGDAARLACATAVAYGSHTLLDWLGSDSSPPIGVMALWPVSREYYESSLHVFMAISRRYWLPEFWTYNLRALARELLILGPLFVVVMGVRWKLTRRAADS